jgi:hypothetical protein
VAASSCTSAVRVSGNNDRIAKRAGADWNANPAARWVAFALLLLFAAVAFADERDDAEKLKAFRDLNPDNRHASQRRVEFHPGYIELHLAGADWRIFYLPFLAPLPGARLEDAGKIPNPFELTGTPYASTASTLPPMFDHDRSREVEREYKRIEKLTKEQKVEVKPQ